MTSRLQPLDEFRLVWAYLGLALADVLASSVRPEHLIRPELRETWARARDGRLAGRTLSLLDLADERTSSAILQAGDELTVGRHDIEGIESRILERWRADTLRRDAGGVLDDLRRGEISSEDAATQLEAAVAMVRSGGSVKVESMASALFRVCSKLEAPGRTQSTRLSQPAPFQQRLGGWRLGRFYVAIAPTSHHKTTFARICAETVAQAGDRSCLWTLEDDADEIAERQAASKFGFLNTGSWVHGLPNGLSAENRAAVASQIDAGWAQRFDVLDLKCVSSRDAEAAISELAAKGTRFVAIDFLQLIEPNDPRETEWSHLGRLSHRLAQLAGRLRIVILATAQITKEATGRAAQLTQEGKLTIGDVYGGSKIAQAAYGVIILQRQKRSDGGQYLLAQVAKWKGAATFELPLQVDPARDSIWEGAR